MRTFISSLRWTSGLLCAGLPACLAAELKDSSPWSTGLDTVLEGGMPIAGDVASGHSITGSALARLEWVQPGVSAGESGWRAYASVLALSGRGPTERFAEDFLAVSNIEGDRGVRLYSWWLERTIKSWQWRVGSLLADEEFAGTETGACFVNSAFGWPAFISANTINTGPAFWVPAAGLRVRWASAPNRYWQLGIYDGDSIDSRAGDTTHNPYGLRLSVGGEQGWFTILEHGGTSASNLTTWKAGGWFHTKGLNDRDPTQRQSRLNYGAYASLEHSLYGEREKPGHIAAYLRGGAAPGDRNPLGWAIDTGIAIRGPWSPRPRDAAALGFARGTFSRQFRDRQRETDDSVPASDFEEVVECAYTLTVGENLSILPSLQYLRHPGGSPARGHAWIGLLRIQQQF